MPTVKDKVELIGKLVCLNDIGFLPTSNSTKPVHIANGLFRRCRGESCDISAIHEWVTSERRKSPSIMSSEQIRDKYSDILINGKHEGAENIANVRFVLEEIFNQDKAAFPSLPNSVLNISSHWLVKDRVASEANIDKFIYEILVQKTNGRSSEAIDMINQALMDDNDDLTNLIKPIITHNGGNGCEKKDYGAEIISLDACKLVIRNAFDHLAKNMKEFGQNKNSLLVLQRMVNLASFSAVYYLISANSTKHSGQRVPLLLDSGAGLPSIEYASGESLIAAKKAVEDLFINSIESMLLEEISDSNSDMACKEYIKQMILNDKNEKAKVREGLLSFYTSFCSDGDHPIHALARALQLMVYTFIYPNNTPSDFVRVLGARVGLVGPSGNAIKKKRFLANRFLLETLTLSAVDTEALKEGIELRELGNILRDVYGIVLGTDVEKDYVLLELNNISQNTPGDLRGDLTLNARAIADMYISVRMAKKYADGVTIVEMEG